MKNLKISLVIFALLAVAQSLLVTLPSRAASVNEKVILHVLDDLASTSSDMVRHGQDDEWTIVLYNAHKTGAQCGGTSTKISGEVDKCVDIKTDKKCADLHVNPDAGVEYCGFSFKSGSGDGGPERQYEMVKGGSDSNGVDLRDDVKFVCVSCKLSSAEQHMNSPLAPSDLR